MSATAHIQLASSSMGVHDDVYGKPKTIRVEKQEGTAATPRLQSVTEYHPGKRVSRRLVYRPDGTLSIREQYEYPGDRLSKVTSFNEAGQQVQTVDVRMIDSETQERVTQGPDGKETERSLIKLSPSGQVVESRMISRLEDSEVVLTIHYDGSDRPTGALSPLGRLAVPSHEWKSPAIVLCLPPSESFRRMERRRSFALMLRCRLPTLSSPQSMIVRYRSKELSPKTQKAIGPERQTFKGTRKRE